jgi:FixJ family two-component response regulator
MIHIVDDDPAVVRALERLLRSWGMQVRTFTSGADFLATFDASPGADCSVIDVQMPGMTGLEVLDRLSAAGLNVPVVFMTAHETEGVEEQAMRAGAVGFLRKPFADEQLIELIRTAVRRREPAVPPAQ